MIKLFFSNDSDFSSNGEVTIKALKAKIHKVDNGEYYLDFECGIEYIDYIVANNILVVPTPQGEQAFRINKDIEVTRQKIKCKARHIFYDSENYVIADAYIVDKNCNGALEHLNSATDNTSPFTTISDVTTVNSFRCVRKSLFSGIQTILERWGGHLVRNNWQIAIRDSIGADNGITIQYKKNLKAISCTEDWSEVCTKILPTGTDGIKLNELDETQDIYLYSTTEYDIPFTKAVNFEQKLKEEDYATPIEYKQALLNDLYQQSVTYLNTHSLPKLNYTLKANIEKVTDIGDIIHVYDERLNVNVTTNVISFDYDCILEKYTELEFGNFKNQLKDAKKTIVKEAVDESTEITKVTLQDGLQNATEQIWSAMGNSYVIYDGDKILIVDRIPKEQADNVILINSNGIGFSKTGINGTFTTAWTIDGTFNAQAVEFINLTADLIKGGVLKLGSNLNQNGVLEVYDEGNTLVGLLDKDGLKMYGKDGSYIKINNQVGFVGYDRNDNRIYWVDKNEFHMAKCMAEEEITFCNVARFVPITRYDGNTLVNDGIGLIPVF